MNNVLHPLWIPVILWREMVLFATIPRYRSVRSSLFLTLAVAGLGACGSSGEVSEPTTTSILDDQPASGPVGSPVSVAESADETTTSVVVETSELASRQCLAPQVFSTALGLTLKSQEQELNVYDDPHAFVDCAYVFNFRDAVDIVGLSFYGLDDPNRAAIADKFRQGVEGWEATPRPDVGPDAYVSLAGGCTIWTPTVEYFYASTSSLGDVPQGFAERPYECAQVELVYQAAIAELD
jgi:hypothetical protein